MEHSRGVLPAERHRAARADHRQPGESRAVPRPERHHRAVRLSLRAMNASCAATLTRDPDHWVGRFVAMASPCEVLIDEAPASLAQQVLNTVATEAWGVEGNVRRHRPA